MAAATEEEAGFWLPSEFLTDDDCLMDKENFNDALDSFPSEFPYHLEPHTADHLLQKFRALSTSPQSTPAYASAGGSIMGPKYDAVGDLIYLSAGQVAKLKLNRGYTAANSCPLPRYPAQFHKEARTHAPSVYPNLQFENNGARAVGVMGEVAWPPQQIPSLRKTALIGGGGAAAKMASAGTGVFLPRRYDVISDRSANSAGPRRRKQLASSSAFQGRAASAQLLHTKPCYDYDTIYNLLHPQPQPQRRTFISDSVLAQRHAVLLQQQLQLQLQRQRRSFLAGELSMIGRDDQCLPREWTY